MFFYPCAALTSLTLVWPGDWLGGPLMAAGLLAALTLAGFVLRAWRAPVTFAPTIDSMANQPTAELPDAA